MTEVERRKDICRSYTGVLVRRGVIKRQPCRRCGDPDSQAHHPDYNNPRRVVWLCGPCHRLHHKKHGPAAAPKPEVSWADSPAVKLAEAYLASAGR